MKRVLISVIGTSPAVLTETIYALINSNNCPDQIIVITTTLGRLKIKEELFDSGIWEELVESRDCLSLNSFNFNSDSIRLLVNSKNMEDAEDLVSSADNTLAADRILGVLREFSENKDTEIIFSVAGGRKTMTALGTLAMTLLGRRCDRLCHVLVNTPFDDPNLQPKFYFPSEQIYYNQSKKQFLGIDAQITLCYIPFPRTRYLFDERYGDICGSFSDLVLETNSELCSQLPPDILLIPNRVELFIINKLIKLSTFEYLIYWMFAVNAKKSSFLIKGGYELERCFNLFCTKICPEVMPSSFHHNDYSTKDIDSIRKAITSLEKKLRERISKSEGIESYLCIPERGQYGLSLDSKYITCPDPEGI